MGNVVLWVTQIDWSMGEEGEHDTRSMEVNDNGDLEIDLQGGVGVIVIKKEQFADLSQTLHELMLADADRKVQAKSFNNSVIITGDNNVVQK